MIWTVITRFNCSRSRINCSWHPDRYNAKTNRVGNLVHPQVVTIILSPYPHYQYTHMYIVLYEYIGSACGRWWLPLNNTTCDCIHRMYAWYHKMCYLTTISVNPLPSSLTTYLYKCQLTCRDDETEKRYSSIIHVRAPDEVWFNSGHGKQGICVFSSL